MKLFTLAILITLAVNCAGQTILSVHIGAGRTSTGIAPPNSIKQYINGYQSYVAFNTDSVTEGTANQWFTNTRARAAITVTTNDTSGAASYAAGVLNIPVYSTTSAVVKEADYFLSSRGSDANSGTGTTAPKLTLPAMQTIINASTLPTIKIALEGGSVFRGADGLSLDRGRVSITAYNRTKAGKFKFPTLYGTDAFTSGWTLTGSNTYQHSIANSFTISINNYAYMYVVEVDTLLEKIAPLTARRYLNKAVSLAAVDTVAGSYYGALINPASSPVTISIHTSDGVSPNGHAKYRYEVVTRDRAINRNLGGNYGSPVSVEQLTTIDFGQGTGNIASRQDSFYMNRCIVMGNAVHQGVYGNYSTINNCGFICGDPNIQEYALVFYQTDGANETNTVSNSIFLDDPQVIYSHTSFGGGGSINHGRLNFYNNYCFNASYAVVEVPLTVDTVDINYTYAKNPGYLTVSSAAAVTMIRNSVVDKGTALIYSNTNTVVDNVLFKSKTTPTSAILLNANQSVKITNSIFHNKTTSTISGEGGRIIGNSTSTSRVTAKYNIFIGEAVPGAPTEFAHANTDAGAGTGPDVFDYNAYIIVSGSPIWKITNGATNGGDPSVFTFANWKTQSGQDSHSIFIDLRMYESDLRRIFVDPAAGNYNLTDSPQADSIRTILAGMRTPLGSFINTPSREQVVDIIENDRFTTVSQLFLAPVTSAPRYGAQIQSGTTTQRNSAGNHYEGQPFYDTTLHKLYTWDGTAWQASW